MSAKVFITILIILAAVVHSGCNNNAIGDNARVVRADGSRSRAAGDDLEAAAPDAARQQEEIRLANERAELAKAQAELAKKEAEFEKKKREDAESQLNELKEDQQDREQVSPSGTPDDAERPARQPRRRMPPQSDCCYDSRSSYSQPAYSPPAGNQRSAASQGYPEQQPRPSDPQPQPQSGYQHQTQPAPPTAPAAPRAEQRAKSQEASQRVIFSGPMPQPEKKKMSKWKKFGIAAAIIGGAVVGEEVIRRRRR